MLKRVTLELRGRPPNKVRLSGGQNSSKRPARPAKSREMLTREIMDYLRQLCKGWEGLMQIFLKTTILACALALHFIIFIWEQKHEGWVGDVYFTFHIQDTVQRAGEGGRGYIGRRNILRLGIKIIFLRIHHCSHLVTVASGAGDHGHRTSSQPGRPSSMCGVVDCFYS